MKKVLFFVFALLLIPVGALFAQDVEPISGLSNWVERFPDLMTSLPGVIAQVIFLPPLLIGFLNIEQKKWKYVLTGGVILILTLLAYFMVVGFLHGAKVWLVAVTFGLLGLGQIIGYALVPGFFNLIADKLNPWKPKPEE